MLLDSRGRISVSPFSVSGVGQSTFLFSQRSPGPARFFHGCGTFQRLCTRGSGRVWLWEAGFGAGDQGDGGAVVIGGHDAAEVGGGEVFGLGMAG